MAGVAAAVATLAIGAGSAVAGGVSASKTRKSNEKLAKNAENNESARRARATEELEKATTAYNELRKQRPGLTVKDYLAERADAIGGPEAERIRQQLIESKQEDFDRAQAVADAASAGNIKTYDVILDAVSGGKSAEILRERNNNALSTNETDAFARALELRSTAIPAGTVRQDSQGRFVEGQRADKQVFQAAFETSEALRDKQFSKLTSILESDRAVAQRQQAKALDFLNQQDVTGLTNALVQAGSAQQLGFQVADETTQLQNIQQFQNAAFTDQTRQVQFQDNKAANSLVSGGFELALKGLGSLGSQNPGSTNRNGNQ